MLSLVNITEMNMCMRSQCCQVCRGPVSHVIWPVTRITMALRDREGQMYPDILTNYMQYYNNNECIMCKCYPDKWKDKPVPVIIPLLTRL